MGSRILNRYGGPYLDSNHHTIRRKRNRHYMIVRRMFERQIDLLKEVING